METMMNKKVIIRGDRSGVFFGTLVKKEGQEVTEKELNEFCRKNLAAYKVPRFYEFRAELPKTAVGKILRRTLVEEEKEKLAASEAK